MPRPTLPRVKEITDIARSLRAEGFTSICIETSPDGVVSITAGASDVGSSPTALKQWQASRGAA